LSQVNSLNLSLKSKIHATVFTAKHRKNLHRYLADEGLYVLALLRETRSQVKLIFGYVKSWSIILYIIHQGPLPRSNEELSARSFSVFRGWPCWDWGHFPSRPLFFTNSEELRARPQARPLF
jgi:hypothetical protein